jgi:poly(3-hydroxyoctanoate) depolymerase
VEAIAVADPPMREERFVRVRGREVRVVRRGAGSGVPLLLLTGIGAHIEMWEPFAERAGDRPLIGLDVPGTGASERPRVPMWMTDFSALVAEVLDELGVTCVDVLGYSWGGALAQQLAFDQPHLVRRVVLCATAMGLGAMPPRPVAGALLLTPARYLHPRLLRMTLPHIAGGRTKREPALLDAQQDARLAHKPDPIGYAGQLYAISGWTSLPFLHRLRQPVLVVAGDDDPTIPLFNARLLVKRIPDARLVVVPGGGHLFLIDEPESVMGEITAFLDDHPPRRAV